MAKIFSKKSSVKLPPRDRVEEHEEWGRELGGVATCQICKNMHYEKEWHHSGIIPEHLKKHKKTITICPACKMMKDRAFEGEIFIENFPATHRKELFNLIAAFGKRAVEIDPQDRIIKTENIKGKYRITTTENQLAVKLAKKIRDVFNAFDLKISHAPEPAEVTRIHILFSEYKKHKHK